MKSVKEKIWQKIKANGQGWAFSAVDFLSFFKRSDVDVALFRLEDEGKIRKVARGIYDYPLSSEILQKNVAPDLDKVAEAIARNNARELQPTGNAALNYLRLSTQVPARWVYLWNGPSKDFQIGPHLIHFKNASRKDFTPKLSQSRLLVQAIRALGDNINDPEIQEKIRHSFPLQLWNKIKTDTALVPGRIHKAICEITQ